MSSTEANTTGELAATLNRDCRCSSVDHAVLDQALAVAVDDPSLFHSLREARPHLFSDTTVFLAPQWAAQTEAVIAAVEAAVALPAYRENVLARAPAIAHHDYGPRGVFLGYDFHLTDSGPRLIEINTNAGGAMLNRLLARAQRACCTPLMKIPAGNGDDDFVEMFRAEWRRQRGETPLQLIAIVDEHPLAQYLYPEFLLFQRLFRQHGIDTLIADPAELQWDEGRLSCRGQAIDLVYNRLTDFYLEEPAQASLRTAYEAGAVVLTPHPRAHALYADKRNLIALTDEETLRHWGVSEKNRACLRQGIARTIAVTPELADALWGQRRHWFFKPAAGYGSKAVYRGEKLTHRVWQEILLSGDYVAQEYAPPGERGLRVNGVDAELKFDVRAYVYDGKVQLYAARLYQGQATNFRTPGGGFAPVSLLPV